MSTLAQNDDLQVDALTKAGGDRLFTEHAPGELTQRPALDEMLNELRPGDAVVVWRLDRLERSLCHPIEMFVELDARGVSVRSLTESIDTSAPGDRLVFHVFGALAEFERHLFRERSMAGLQTARASSRRGGRSTA